MQGWVTITATILYVLTEGVKTVWPDYAPAVTAIQNGIILPMGAVGVARKLDRAAIVRNVRA